MEPSAAVLVERLRGRRREIEQEALARVYSLDDPTATGDPEYVAGLRAAVSVAVSYALAWIEGEESSSDSIPAELLTQARHAARSGVGIEIVLRRYLAGFTLLGDFVMQEAEAGELLDTREIQRLVRRQAELFDRLVAVISGEYRSEAEAKSPSPEQRRAEQVERLLAGELTDTSHLAYDLDAWHIAVIAAGPKAELQLQNLAATLDRRLLLLPRGRGGRLGLPRTPAVPPTTA